VNSLPEATLPGELFLLVAELSRIFTESLDLDTVLQRVSQRTTEVMGDASGIFLNPSTGLSDDRLQMVSAYHRNPDSLPPILELLRELPFRLGEGLAGTVATTGRPILLADAQHVLLPEPSLSRVRRLNIRSAIIVPLKTARGVLGVMITIVDQSHRAYSDTDVTLSMAIAERAAVAIENARLYAESQARAAQLETIVDSIADAVAVVDVAGNVVELNRAWLEHMGLRSKEDGLRSLAAYADAALARRLDGSPVEAADFAVGRALQGEIVKDVQIQLSYPDGHSLIVSTTASPIRDGEGKLVGAVAISRDVGAALEKAWELERANAELRELNRLKTDFLSTVSHELRTPLTSILGYTALLMRGAGLSETHRRRIASIEQSGRRLLSLIDDLLELSTIESGTIRLTLQPAHIGRLIESAISACSRLAQDKKIRVSRDVAPGLPALHIDENRLTKVLENLLSNAIKFSPQGASVHIRAWLPSVSAESGGNDSDGLCVSVQDRGIGLDQERMKNIWQKFYQAEPASTRHSGGTGIGLATCKRLVEAHGGRIWGESAGEGQGATFTFFLPLPSHHGHAHP